MSNPSKQGYDFGTVTERIIGTAIEVHKNLGPGFREIIYQRALVLELEAAGMEFAREEKVPIYYKGRLLGRRRADFVVENCMVEIKAKGALEEQDFVQALSYVKASGYRLGLLLNFGTRKLEIRRLVNDRPTYQPEKHVDG